MGGNDLYNVEGTNFTWGIQNTLKHKKVMTLHPTFEVFRDGKLWAKCSHENKIGFGAKEALLDIPGDNNYKIKGNRYATSFEIQNTGTGIVAATVTKVPG